MRAHMLARKQRGEDGRQSLNGRPGGGPRRTGEDVTPLVAHVLALQSSAGNAAVSRLFAGGASSPTAVPANEGDEEDLQDGAEPSGTTQPAPAQGEAAGASDLAEPEPTGGGQPGDLTEPAPAQGEAAGPSDLAEPEPTGGGAAGLEGESGTEAGAEPTGGAGAAGLEGESGTAAGGASAAGSEGANWTEGDGAGGPGAGWTEGDGGGGGEGEGDVPDVVEEDPFLPLTGGGPVASGPGPSPASTGGSGPGFVDLGRVGSSAAGEPISDETYKPHAFTDGGRAGSAQWSGGGPGGGPKGNEEAGSTSPDGTVQPKYVSRSNGVLRQSEAWVTPGTGTVSVVRQWFGAEPGDQGNGWYVTDAAAARLNQHEELHVQKSREYYSQFLDPMMNWMATWGPTGNHATAYLQWSAISTLEAAVGWDKALESFFVQDRLANVNGGIVDQDDLSSGTYPQRFPSPEKPEQIKIGGKDYASLLKMPGEKTPA